MAVVLATWMELPIHTFDNVHEGAGQFDGLSLRALCPMRIRPVPILGHVTSAYRGYGRSQNRADTRGIRSCPPHPLSAVVETGLSWPPHPTP